MAKRPEATMNDKIQASELMAEGRRKRRREEKQQQPVQTAGPVRAFKYSRDAPGHYWVLGALESCRACVLDQGICVIGADWSPGQLCTPCQLKKTACTLSRRTQGGTKSRPHLAGDLHKQACEWVASWNLVDQAPVGDKGKGRAVEPVDAPAMVPVRQVQELESHLASMQSDLESLTYQNADLKYRLQSFEQDQGTRSMEGIVETGSVEVDVDTGIGPFAPVQRFVDRLREERLALQQERAQMAVLMDDISKLL